MATRPATRQEYEKMTPRQREYYDEELPNGAHVPVCLMKDGTIQAQPTGSGMAFALQIKDVLRKRSRTIKPHGLH